MNVSMKRIRIVTNGEESQDEPRSYNNLNINANDMTRPKGDVGRNDNPVSIQSYEAKNMVCSAKQHYCEICRRDYYSIYYYNVRCESEKMYLVIASKHSRLTANSIYDFLNDIGFENFGIRLNDKSFKTVGYGNWIYIVDGWADRLSVDRNRLMHAINGNMEQDLDFNGLDEFYEQQDKVLVKKKQWRLKPDIVELQLPNGSKIKYDDANSDVVDAYGEAYENYGIPPKQEDPIVVDAYGGNYDNYGVPIGIDKSKRKLLKKNRRDKFHGQLANLKHKAKFIKGQKTIRPKVSYDRPLVSSSEIDLSTSVEDNDKDTQKEKKKATILDFVLNLKPEYTYAYTREEGFDYRPNDMKARFFKIMKRFRDKFVSNFSHFKTLITMITTAFAGLISLMKFLKDIKVDTNKIPILGLIDSFMSNFSNVSWKSTVLVCCLLITYFYTLHYREVKVHKIVVDLEQDPELVPVNDDVDLRREGDKAFDNILSVKNIYYEEIVKDKIEYGHDFGMFNYYNVVTDSTIVSDKRLVDVELLTQMTAPRVLGLNNSIESVIDRLASSTNAGPFINYNRNGILVDDVSGNATRFAVALAAAPRCSNLETDIYNHVFRSRDVLRLVRVPRRRKY